MSGRRVCLVRDQLHGEHQRRRVRQRHRRSLQRNRQHLRRRLPGQQLHLPRRGGRLRRGGNLHRIVQHVSGGRLRLGRNNLYGIHQHRCMRQRRGRSLQRVEQHMCRRVSGQYLHLPRLGGPMRRGGDLHRIVERLPAGRVRLVGDHLHGRRQRRRVRQGRVRPLQRVEQRLRRRLSDGDVRVPRHDGSVRRRGVLHRIVEHLPGGRVRLVRDDVHGGRQRRRVRQRHGRSLQRNRQHLRRRLSGEFVHLPRLRRCVRRGRIMHRDVGRMPGGRVRLVGDELHG